MQDPEALQFRQLPTHPHEKGITVRHNRICPSTSAPTNLPTLLCQDPDALQFRQLPTFADCFPASEKHYREVDHNGALLRVRLFISCIFEKHNVTTILRGETAAAGKAC